MRFAWPHPRVGVRRLVGALRPGAHDVNYGPSAIALVERLSHHPSRPHGLGRAWPMFAVRFANRREFKRSAAAIAALTTARATGSPA